MDDRGARKIQKRNSQASTQPCLVEAETMFGGARLHLTKVKIEEGGFCLVLMFSLMGVVSCTSFSKCRSRAVWNLQKGINSNI